MTFRLGLSRALAAALLVAIPLGLAACGGGDDTTAAPSGDGGSDGSTGDDGSVVIGPGAGDGAGDGGAPGPMNDGGELESDAASGPTFAIGGTITGLATGANVVLADNSGDDLTVSANGAFHFTTALASGAMYSVTVTTQPTAPAQTCIVTNASGSVASAAITSIAIHCTTDAFSVGGTVAGLVGGGLVLQNDLGDDLAVTPSGTGTSAFTFNTRVPSGTMFDVTVKTQPTAPVQTCSVVGGTGSVAAGNVSSVTVNCTTMKYTIGGSISGLAGTGLVLQNNGGDHLAMNVANGTFAFATPIDDGQMYKVTVLTQPSSPAQICTVTAGSGPVRSEPVTTVAIACRNAYSVNATVSGLATGDTLVLQDNGGDDLMVTASGTSAFATKVATGAAYAVTVKTNPTTPTAQACAITSIDAGHGTIATANVTVTVACATLYTVSATVTGLLANETLVLQDNGGDDLAFTANSTTAFKTSIASGKMYNVTVHTQPSTPGEICAVTTSGSPASGIIGSANVVVGVACASGYFVNVTTGADTNAGTSTAPWKTITHAIATVPTTGGTINVAPGTYNAASGEAFPIEPRSNEAIVGDVVNDGNGTVPTLVSGGGAYEFAAGSFRGFSTFNYAVAFVPGVTGASMSGFTVTATNGDGSGDIEGVAVDGATVSFTNNTVTGSNDISFWEGDGAKLTLTNTTIQGGNWNLAIADATTSILARGNSFAGAGTYAVNVGYSGATALAGTNIDFGTAASAGNNSILGSAGGVGLITTVATTGAVQAVGNTWHPNVQGATAAGKYAATLITGAVATTAANNYALAASSSLQF